MTQIINVLRAGLKYPLIYNFFQSIMGSHHGRLEFAKKHIRPYSGVRILDIACGTAEILAYLPEDIEYCGYDISSAYISAAKERYSSRGTFNCCLFDINAFAQKPSFDIVLIIGALHHMDDAVVQSLLLQVFSVLSPIGRLITIDPCYAEGQNPISRFLISHDRGQNVRTPEAYSTLMRSIFPNVHGTLRHRLWIPYTHWIMECSK